MSRPDIAVEQGRAARIAYLLGSTTGVASADPLSIRVGFLLSASLLLAYRPFPGKPAGDPNKLESL